MAPAGLEPGDGNAKGCQTGLGSPSWRASVSWQRPNGICQRENGSSMAPAGLEPGDGNAKGCQTGLGSPSGRASV